MPRSSTSRWVRVSALLLVLAAMVLGLSPAGSLLLGGAPAVAAAAAAAPTPLPTSLHPLVGVVGDPATGGYWMAATDGGVFAFGAPFYGSAGGIALDAPIVGMAATPDGGGYWLVASDGGVFSYGDARFAGSTGGLTLRSPIVGMQADPATGGYWLVAGDGGVFAFGAPFYGSAGSMALDAPIVGMAATPDGLGYWLVAADGGVFSYGDARFAGSTGGLTLRSPIVGMQADPATGGYWLVAGDGGVFAFGAPFYGSAAGHLGRRAVGLSPTPDGGGYRVVSGDGGVFAYGDATYQGSVYVPPLAGETVAIDPGHDGGNAGDPALINQPIDNGNGTESCDTAGTETADGYTEHAFNFDVASRLEALLEAQGATVVMTRTNDTGVGPCVNQRAAIGNAAHAAVAISIHADGGPVSGRGFDVIAPAPVVSSISNNTAIVPASLQLAADVRNSFGAATGEPTSDYAGVDGIDQRSDLGGLNLTTVPKVLIETANMQNPADAALTESPQWRQQAAQGLADGISAYLTAQSAP